MPRGVIFGVDRPFVEDDESSIKIVVEFANMITKEDVRRDSQMVVAKLEDEGFIINDIIVDEGVTPLLMMDMARTNINYSNLQLIHDTLTDMQGFKGMTVSTVPLERIERFSKMR